MVCLDFAAAAAFLMFFLAAARCFSVLIDLQGFLTDPGLLVVATPFLGGDPAPVPPVRSPHHPPNLIAGQPRTSLFTKRDLVSELGLSVLEGFALSVFKKMRP